MNPAIRLLLRLQGVARWRRLRDTFSNRRRLLLTLAAMACGMIWLGQSIAVVLFREPYDPREFRRWTALVLTAYFGWHFIRVAYKRPDAAIEWSPAEVEHLTGGPFERHDLLIYRFLVVLTSTLPKALVTAFVLLPDLWWSGLPGIILALVFLECVRTALDLAVCCLSERSYLAARIFIFGFLLSAALVAYLDRGATLAIETPLVAFAEVITAQSISVSLLVSSLIVLALVGGMLVAIAVLDRWHEALTHRRQQLIRAPEFTGNELSFGLASGDFRWPLVPRLGAIGPVVWRQLKSAGRYRGSLFVALAIPAVLSCAPFFSVEDTTLAFFVLVGTVVFYSFVLLPEAVKFDFRLDCDHIAQLKLLPISPLRVVVGQLTVPILVATIFQVSMFVMAGAVRSVAPNLVVAAILLTVPTNGLFVAIDNLIFLLYPHRPTQEGFEAFLRTMLKFTFKSLLLSVIGAAVFCCALASRLLVDAAGVPHLVQECFFTGVTLSAWCSAVAAVVTVAKAFDRFDVSLTVPT